MGPFEDKQMYEEHERHLGMATRAMMSLESLTEVLGEMGYTSPTSGMLVNHILSSVQESMPDLTLDNEQTGHGLTAVMEDIQAFSMKAANTIFVSSKEVNKWLNKVIEHLERDAAEFEDRLSRVSGEVKVMDRKAQAPGTFQYRSIMRNLSTGDKIIQAKLAENVDKFPTKLLQIRASINSQEFRRLLQVLETFDQTGERIHDMEALQEVFKAVDEYAKVILPYTRTGFYTLEASEGRVIRVDPQVYIGGKVIYSFVPSEIAGGADTVTSGILRTTAEQIDLKADVPYLSMERCDDLLKHISSHVQRYKTAPGFKETTEQLTALIEKFSRKFVGATRTRKKQLDPRVYVVLMNITSGFLYGLHVKALNQTSSVLGACLKYVEKSVQETQKGRG